MDCETVNVDQANYAATIRKMYDYSIKKRGRYLEQMVSSKRSVPTQHSYT